MAQTVPHSSPARWRTQTDVRASTKTGHVYRKLTNKHETVLYFPAIHSKATYDKHRRIEIKHHCLNGLLEASIFLNQVKYF